MQISIKLYCLKTERRIPANSFLAEIWHNRSNSCIVIGTTIEIAVKYDFLYSTKCEKMLFIKLFKTLTVSYVEQSKQSALKSVYLVSLPRKIEQNFLGKIKL